MTEDHAEYTAETQQYPPLPSRERVAHELLKLRDEIRWAQTNVTGTGWEIDDAREKTDHMRIWAIEEGVEAGALDGKNENERKQRLEKWLDDHEKYQDAVSELRMATREHDRHVCDLEIAVKHMRIWESIVALITE